MAKPNRMDRRGSGMDEKGMAKLGRNQEFFLCKEKEPKDELRIAVRPPLKKNSYSKKIKE